MFQTDQTNVYTSVFQSSWSQKRQSENTELQPLKFGASELQSLFIVGFDMYIVRIFERTI